MTVSQKCGVVCVNPANTVTYVPLQADGPLVLKLELLNGLAQLTILCEDGVALRLTGLCHMLKEGSE